MEIKRGDLRIRPAGLSDCKQLLGRWNDGEVMAHAGFPKGLGLSLKEVERKVIDRAYGKPDLMIIEYSELPIGELYYKNISPTIAEIGIKICRPFYQEKGLGRLSLSLLIRELFSMGFEKIVLDTNLKNTRAQHVYELLGFRKLRIRENSRKDQEGRLQSTVDYELLPEDFVDFSVK